MLVGDKIEVGMISEMSGVPSANILYYEVVDPTIVSSIQAALLEIATNFNNALGAVRSSSAVFTCATWNNLEGNDPFTQTFFNLPGAGPAASLPTQACIRVRRYGIQGGAIKVGGINVTGIVETSVSRGRLVDDGELATVEAFLLNNQILAAGPTLKPGFFIDTAAPTPPVWVDTLRTQTVSRVRTLTKRRSRLCGQ